MFESEFIRFFLGNLNNWARLVFNEQNMTLDTIRENKCVKFSPQEEELLVDTVISALSILKGDLLDMYEGKGRDITENDKERLASRVGLTIASRILERDDAGELIDAIFFGE